MDSKFKKLTKEVMAAAVAKDLTVSAENIEVQDLQVTGGLPEGTNYSSVVIKINVTAKVMGTSIERSYIAKFLVHNPKREAMMKQHAIYENECEMYLNVLPGLTALDDQIKVPKIFYANSKNSVIIMEDLNIGEWSMKPKSVCMDLSLSKAVLEWLARFHAASYHFIETFDGGLACFSEQNNIIMDNNRTQGSPHQNLKLFRAVYAAYKAIIADCPEHVSPEIVEKVNQMTIGNYNEIARVQEAKGAFNCINHGDVWANNFMFKEDGLAETQVCALDFQLSRYSRPTNDVVSFLWATMDSELRSETEDELLDYYHRFLIGRFKSFGYTEDIYPRAEFDKDYHESRIFGVTVSVIIQMLKLALGGDKDATVDFLHLGQIKEEAELQDYITKFVMAQLKMSRERPMIREELLSVAKEAVKKGII